MARKDWYYLNLPKLLVKRLDEYMQSPEGRKMVMTNKSELVRHLINQFLDEQESFYSNLDSIEDLVLDIKDRDHFILTCENDRQLEEILRSFLHRGIKFNAINILNILKEEESRFLRALSKCELDIDKMFNSYDIMIVWADDCFHDQKFFVEPFVKSIEQAKDIAKKRQKSGLNVLSTTAGTLVKKGRVEDAIVDEHQAHKLVRSYEIPLTLVCVYPFIPDSVLEQLSEYHDIVIKHTVAAT